MTNDFKYDNGDLLKDFRQGKQTAFTAVFNMHYASVCYYAFRITNDSEQSEDIVMESFIKIWEKRTIFFELKVLKSYLYTTVKNASLDHLRKTSKIKLVDYDEEAKIHESGRNIFDLIVEAEVFDQLTNAMSKLSAQGKQVIRMMFFEGRNTRDVAQKLGVSQSTVKTQKARALVKLKKTFQQ